MIFRGFFQPRSQTRRVNRHGNAIPGLRLQRDDLLAQRAALEDDLGTSFVAKFDLRPHTILVKHHRSNILLIFLLTNAVLSAVFRLYHLPAPPTSQCPFTPRTIERNSKFERTVLSRKSIKELYSETKIPPIQISTNEDWWLFVLWRRIDPRILWTDITMRMEMPQRTAKVDTKWNNRIVNIQRRIWSKHYYMLPWFNRNLVDITNIHNALRERNIPLHLNTTRGLTPGLKDTIYRFLSHVPLAMIPYIQLFMVTTSRPMMLFR